MATRTTAKTTAKTNTNECVIKCNPHRELACGYTKVKIMPENYSRIVLIACHTCNQNYSRIVLIAGMTGKSIQDLTNELLNYAIDYVVIDVDGNKINFSDVQGVR